MTENEYLKLPWSVENTIENIKEIKEIMVAKVRTVNLDGKAESDAKEVSFDFDRAISALKEIQQYRALGTVEELSNSVKEEDVLKFYYCESEDDYYIGQRMDTRYYARYGKTGFTWFMSRHLPWGEHVTATNAAWKEYIYPSEPKEIPFFEWLIGFLKKYCGGTVEELCEAMEKQRAKKPITYMHTNRADCPVCGSTVRGIDKTFGNWCSKCGQAIGWSEEDE